MATRTVRKQMTTLNKSIHDAESNTYEVLPLNESEIAEIEARKLQDEINKTKIQEKTEARLSLLERLGITEDEARLLLG